MQQQIVTLPSPIKVNGNKIDKVTLTRQPTGRDLGQYTIFDVLEGNIKALAHVTPKISSSPLSNGMIKDTAAANHMALVAGYSRFFDGLEPDGLVETVDPSQTMETIPTTKASTKT